MTDRLSFIRDAADGPNVGNSIVGIAGPGLQFHLLAEITNFVALRRHVGCTRADVLASDVAARIATVMPSAKVAIAGRTTIACWFVGDMPAALEAAIAQVRAAFALPFDLDGERHTVTLTIGAASAPVHGADEVRIVEEAEAALAEARAGERSVTHDIAAPSSREMRRLARELDLAIDRGELLILYQPKIHVRQQQIRSAEGLLRWRHPERGLILPGDFIPVAEACHLIDRITLWTIRQAIDDQRALAAQDHDLRLFINISGQLLGDTAFVREACDLVAGSDAKLGFEITETSVIRDPESAIANLQVFADYGITIAIDDYGAGLSSLAYLKQLPARELKIDKLFVTQLTSSNRDPLIVRSTIDLAHALEMEVVAEGVETHSALALLTVMGCDMVQGFLISRPIALDALMIYLDEDRHQSTPQEARNSFTNLAVAWKRG